MMSILIERGAVCTTHQPAALCLISNGREIISGLAESEEREQGFNHP